jgi:hypothetical protein
VEKKVLSGGVVLIMREKIYMIFDLASNGVFLFNLHGWNLPKRKKNIEGFNILIDEFVTSQKNANDIINIQKKVVNYIKSKFGTVLPPKSI